MSISTISHIIYLVTMFFSGLIMGDIGLSFKSWKYWAILVCFITVYCCGYIAGGCQ